MVASTDGVLHDASSVNVVGWIGGNTCKLVAVGTDGATRNWARVRRLIYATVVAVDVKITLRPLESCNAAYVAASTYRGCGLERLPYPVRCEAIGQRATLRGWLRDLRISLYVFGPPRLLIAASRTARSA